MLAKFIRTLAATENPMPVIGTAFSEVAKQYRIGVLKSVFFVAPSLSTRQGEDREDIFFRSGDAVENEPAYSVTYHTGEKGVATFYIYRLQGEPEFTETEKEELRAYMDTILVVFGRFRLINAVKQMGHTDFLTGLPNTGGFLSYIDEVIRKGDIQKYNTFYFNLAHFSLINKRFGTKETDRIIQRYAAKASEFLQEEECLGRLGGDNFVALIKKERTFDFLNLLASVTTYGVLGDREVPVSISAVAGIAENQDSLKHCGTLLEDSGMALNVAKHVIKKPYAFASEEMKMKMYKEKQYISRFTEALQKREFKAYYQPKVRTDDYSIIGAEALVRWEYNGTLIPPGDFIPMFERNGMICALDFYMIEQVCSDIKHWLQMGIDPGRISMNLSRKHLSNPHLAEDIMQILRKYETESKYVEIELTETVDEEESEQLVHFMNQMKAYDISMSIDDFGTGYSSLNLLRTFPVDVLKIDKIFIDTLDKNDKIVLSNIIRMAMELNMSIVAEGVETWQQMECLKEMGCIVVQGFLFDRPMPREDLEKKMLQKTYDITLIKK